MYIFEIVKLSLYKGHDYRFIVHHFFLVFLPSPQLHNDRTFLSGAIIMYAACEVCKDGATHHSLLSLQFPALSWHRLCVKLF